MTKENKIYKRHQAFNKVYLEIKIDHKMDMDGFETPKQYHHDPSKLDVFKNFTHYISWANELFASGKELIKHLKIIYDTSSRASSSFYELNSEKYLKDILSDLDDCALDLESFRDDIHEFQLCLLATHISEKGTEIQALSEHLDHLSFMELKIIETCNRKMFEISSSRMAFYSSLISFIAVVLSLFALVRP